MNKPNPLLTLVRDFVTHYKTELLLAGGSALLVEMMPNWMLASVTFLGVSYYTVAKQQSHRDVGRKAAQTLTDSLKKAENYLEQPSYSKTNFSTEHLLSCCESATQTLSDLARNNKKILLTSGCATLAALWTPRSMLSTTTFLTTSYSLVSNQEKNNLLFKQAVKSLVKQSEALNKELAKPTEEEGKRCKKLW